MSKCFRVLEEQHKDVFHIATKGFKQVEKLNQIRDDDIYTRNIYHRIYKNKQNKTKPKTTFLFSKTKRMKISNFSPKSHSFSRANFLLVR